MPYRFWAGRAGDRQRLRHYPVPRRHMPYGDIVSSHQHGRYGGAAMPADGASGQPGSISGETVCKNTGGLPNGRDGRNFLLADITLGQSRDGHRQQKIVGEYDGWEARQGEKWAGKLEKTPHKCKDALFKWNRSELGRKTGAWMGWRIGRRGELGQYTCGAFEDPHGIG